MEQIAHKTKIDEFHFPPDSCITNLSTYINSSAEEFIIIVIRRGVVTKTPHGRPRRWLQQPAVTLNQPHAAHTRHIP